MAGRKEKDGYVCQPAAMVNRMRLRLEGETFRPFSFDFTVLEKGIYFNARGNVATIARGDEQTSVSYHDAGTCGCPFRGVPAQCPGIP